MDSKNLAEEGLEHLKALVSFDTSNPPGNEMPAVKYLDKVLRNEGFEPTIIESAPNRGNIVARLAGDGTEKPLLLLSHLDVVPAEANKWAVDPFAAEEKDGYLYGRGTLDMKQMTAMSLMALCSLKRKKAALKRDVIFAAVADEEAGGRYGAAHLVENHPELIRAEFALCEMGGFRIEVKGHTYFPVQVAERGCAWCKVRYTGEPGHGSIPNSQSAISKMLRSLLRLEKKGLPFHVTDVVRDFVSLVASDQKAPVRATMKALLNPLTSRMALGRMEKEQARVFYAQLHSTATPTVLRSGEKENVIPAEAEVVLDGRVLPGQDWDSFQKELTAVLGKEAEIELIQWTDPLVYPSDTTLFDVIRRVLTDREPGAGVVPFLLTGYTDAKHLDKLGTVTYGFSPMNNDPEERVSKLIHGHDERIGLDAFRWGVGVLEEVVERFCSAPSSNKAVDTLMEELLEPVDEGVDSSPRQRDQTRPDGLAADKQDPDE